MLDTQLLSVLEYDYPVKSKDSRVIIWSRVLSRFFLFPLSLWVSLSEKSGPVLYKYNTNLIFSDFY